MRFGSPTSRSRLRLQFAPFDLFWVSLAPLIALALRDPALLRWGDFPSSPPDPYLFALVTIACAIPSLLVFRLSEGITPLFSVPDVFAVCSAVAMTVGSSGLILFSLTRLDGVPRSTPLIDALVLGVGLLGGRTLSRVVGHERAKSRAEPASDRLRRVILVGADRFSSMIISLVECQVPQTTRIVAIADDKPDYVGRAIRGVRVVSMVGDLGDIIQEYALHGVDIDAVWISDQSVDLPETMIDEIESDCARRAIACQRVAEVFNLTPLQSRSTVQTRIATATRTIQPSAYFRLKRAIDIVASAALIVALAPLWALVAGLVLFDVGTPVHFWQERIGRTGRRFLIYKFRTYQAPFDWRGGVVSERDRLSPIGRFVRESRLDELPQLLNIFVGDMSLIGPRPLLPHDQPADPSTRLTVRPGITGWAQVNGGNLVTSEEKDALDEYYIRNASFLFDVKIVWMTLRVIFAGERRNPGALQNALALRRDRQPAPELQDVASCVEHALS
jgi:lipopolysaccharide/colanic/teichoic acid biosynthesis glycosyltransferase